MTFETKRVAVIGAGEMGHGIAEVFAVKGYPVTLMDKYPEALDKARTRIRASLERSVEKGRLTGDQVNAALSRISFSGSLVQAVSEAELVIEAVPEIEALKVAVMREAGDAAPAGAVLASNTSNIRITRLAQLVPRPERVVGMHFFNPPMVMKLVEVIAGEATDPAVVEEVMGTCGALGKTPIRVLKDSPGFVVNRINAAEALFFCLLQDKNIASPEEVDSFAREQGLPRGPYELMDFVGVDVAQEMLSYFAEALSAEYGKGVTLSRMVQEGRLGKKAGRGFYEWSSGAAQIPKTSPTDKISLLDIFSIEINEAVKLIEEGVALPDDVERGVVLGMGRPFGPITVAKDLTNAEVRSRLQELASKLDCSVFAPAKSIAEGRMREALEGRLKGEASSAESKTPAATSTEGAAASRPVRVEKPAVGVAMIVLNRPRLNTLNAEVLDGLDQAMTSLWDDSGTRVVILTGQGSVFSAGADLSQHFSSSVSFLEFTRKGARIVRRLTEFPKLTIAVVKGYALGGGLELAMSCDLRLATEDVQLGLPEVRRGLVPGLSGTQRMAQLIGLSRASAFVLTGETMSGKRAYEIGLVSRLVPPGDPDQFAIGYGTELASTLAPVSVMLAKRLLNKGSEVPSDVGLEMESLASGIVFGTRDLREGVSAFLGKRKPEFEGR